jgi:hypothetical protein
MTTPYKTAHYFTYWRFPTAAPRIAYIPLPKEYGKVAWQESDNSFWVATPVGWHLLSDTLHDPYIPTSSYAGEVIPAGKQRLVYGDFEIVGDLELIGDLVIL